MDIEKKDKQTNKKKRITARTLNGLFAQTQELRYAGKLSLVGRSKAPCVF